MISDADILRRISEGESLRSICRREGLAESTTRIRFRDNPDLAAQYARARDAQADHYAERIVDEALTATDYQTGRLRMDALKWAASKLAPKRYGDRIAHVGGGDDDNPIRQRIDADPGYLALAAALGGHAARPTRGADDDGAMEGAGAAEPADAGR